MDNVTIEEIARRYVHLYSEPFDDETFRRPTLALLRLDNVDVLCLRLVEKLLEGKPYGILSDNPESIKRVRSIAAHLGATVREVHERGGRTGIIFDPPPKN
jgi:hypothetical protein